MPENLDNKEINALSSVLLETGALLMVSGASTGRVRNTVSRISDSFGYSTDMLISQRTLMLNLRKDGHTFTNLKRTPMHGVNFSVLSGISRMSWLISEEKWSVSRINDDLKRIAELPHYPRIVVLALVGLAGAAFCRLAGGGIFEMLVVYIGSFLGLCVKQEASKRRFNPYICVYFAAFTSSLIAGIPAKFSSVILYEQAVATSVLFLIPGVPLINSFSDIIDGNLQNGLIRGLNGLIISFIIALGLLTSMFIYNL